MATVLISGANRGIGLEFARQYLQQGWRVIATCRDRAAASELRELEGAELEIRELDVTSKASIKELVGGLAPRSISIYINNAGVYGPRGVQFGLVKAEDWMEVLQVNTIAPLMLTQQLLSAMDTQGERKLIYLSSKVGSIADNSSGGNYIYRSSKTALNQVVKSLAVDLEEQGFKVAALHPGWVKTDMGGPNALIEPATSVAGMIQVINDLDREGSGGFFNYDGTPIPW